MRTIVEANLYKAADALLDAEYLVQDKRRQRDDLIRKAAPGMTRSPSAPVRRTQAVGLWES